MARPRTAVPEDVLEQIVTLDEGGVSVAAIARCLGLSRWLVTERLKEHAAEASVPAQPRRCVWPYCDQEPSASKVVCYFHDKVARGLIQP